MAIAHKQGFSLSSHPWAFLTLAHCLALSPRLNANSENGHNWTRTSDPYDVNVVL